MRTINSQGKTGCQGQAGEVLSGPLSVGHRTAAGQGPGPDLLSQSVQAQSPAMCVFNSFPGEDQQFGDHWPGYPLRLFQA